MPRFPGGCCLPLQARACQFAIVLATSVLRPGHVIASKCLGFQSVVIFLLRLPVRRNLRPSNPARLKEFAGSSRFRRYCRILDRRILDRFQFFQPLQQEMLFVCDGHGSAKEQATERNPGGFDFAKISLQAPAAHRVFQKLPIYGIEHRTLFFGVTHLQLNVGCG